MNRSLSPRQALLLGGVLMLGFAIVTFAVFRVGQQNNVHGDCDEFTVIFPEAHDITPGTAVRVRGVVAGEVQSVSLADGLAEEGVLVRFRLNESAGNNLYADATAQIHSTGMLGTKVIAIQPGQPQFGPLQGYHLRSQPSVDLAEAAAKLTEVADEAKLLLQEARTGHGSLAKLIQDDELYTELSSLAKETRGMIQRTSKTVDSVEGKVADVDQFVQDGRETLRSVKQGTDAVQRMPIIRGYVENAAALLVRPDCKKDGVTYAAQDLFQANSSILTDAGKNRLNEVSDWLRGNQPDNAEVVVVALDDPQNPDMSAAGADELTRKQTETVIEYLKTRKAHKIGWFSSRKMTPLGLGQGPSPVVESKPMPKSYLQVLLYTPQ